MEYKTSDLKLTELQALAELTQEMVSEISIEPLLAKILQKSGEFIESSSGSIILFDPYEKSLFFAAVTGDDSQYILNEWGRDSKKRVPINGSISGKVFLTGKATIENSIESHFNAIDLATNNITSSVICVPLNVAGQSIGVMQFINKEDNTFVEYDLTLLGAFANICAISIRNAQYIEDLIAHMGLSPTVGGDESISDVISNLSRPARTEELSIMFADMRGFSRMSVVISDPQECLEKLNEYLAMVTEEVHLHGGVVNKIMGDGVLALFTRGEKEKDAVRCSFSIIKKFTALIKDWNEHVNVDLGFLDIGFGITTDRVTIGTLRGKYFRDYSVTGTPVNLASSFEKEARAGKRVLVDQKTYQAVKYIVKEMEGPLSYEFRKSGPLQGIFTQYFLKSLYDGPATKMFVSHQQADRDFIENVIVRQLNTFNIKTWYSPADIPPEEEKWPELIAQGLADSDWVIVVVSKHSVASEWVRMQVEAAIKENRFHRKIIPIQLDATAPSMINDWLASCKPIIATDISDLGQQIYCTINDRRKN